ncbi:MAG TPA: O-antigen ligase family protein [Candidatus Tectomicrobia bacterium]|nr:O-antigen ligase family protein [Candidatus Tectomicrobia bacterium]
MRHRHRHKRQAEARPWSEPLIESGVLALLVFTPLSYGTVEPWSEAISELVILGMGLVWLLSMLQHWELRLELPGGWQPAGLFLALIVIQTLPLPNALISLISPSTATLMRGARGVTGDMASTMALSLQLDSAWRMALKFLALALFFLVTYNTYRRPAQVRRAVWVMIGMGTLIALFGLAQRMTSNGRFYWVGPEGAGANAFGPFVNRVHFAGLIVTILPMALALMLVDRSNSRRRQQPRHWQERLRAWNSRQGGPASLIPWLVFLMGGAALVGGSRGGLLALLMALLIMVGLSAYGSSGRKRARRMAITAGLTVLTAIWIGSDVLYGTIERLAEEIGQPETSPRLRLWADALDLWWQFPTFGTGLGTFGVVFPLVRTLPAPVTFTHAESDWIQLLTDTGIMGVLLASLTVGMSAAALLRRYRGAKNRWTYTFTLAGLVALAGAVVQGIANFNLPVMSNFVYLALAMALALRAEDIAGGDDRACVARSSPRSRQTEIIMATPQASSPAPQDDRARVTI